MSMIEQIISDAKAMEAETIRAEEDSQKAYEDYVKDTNASIEAKNKDIINKSEVKATSEGALVRAKEGKESVWLNCSSYLTTTPSYMGAATSSHRTSRFVK